MTSESPLEFVRASAVRTALLEAVVEGPARRRALVRRLDASESAVYQAVGDLADREIICADDGVWRPTGVGRILADLIEHRRDTATVLDDAAGFWRDHDATAIPAPFRRRLADLAGCTVVSGTNSDPERALRTVRERLDAADRIDAITAVHLDQLSASVERTDATRRFVLARSLVEEFGSDPPVDSAAVDGPVRVAPADLSMVVTEDWLCMSLPDADGRPDVHTQLVADGERAIQWGRDLFESHWQAGVPLERARDDSDP
jgi:predicted transcriptional regulator